MSPQPPSFGSTYIVVAGMAVSLAFYRRLGLTINETGADFARAVSDDGRSVEFGTDKLTQSYDPGWNASLRGTGGITLNFALASRDAVDATFADLTGAGFRGHLAPIDAFWGARFAIVLDPDGNFVGLQSPRDAASDDAAL